MLSPNNIWDLAMDCWLDIRLPDKHYQDAMRHERSLVCLMMTDRKVIREVEELPRDAFVDPMWCELFRRLTANPFRTPKLLLAELEGFAVRQIVSAIRSSATGVPYCFAWNIRWHQAEIKRLFAVRQEFLRSKDFVLEHCA